MEGNLDPEEIRRTLAEGSGWRGVSGVSDDLREVMAAAEGGHGRARLAVDLFLQSLRRAIGAMTGVLGGVDAIVFSGGIGEHSAHIRAEAVSAAPGLELDVRANDTVGVNDSIVSTPRSAVRALVIHAQRILVVLREARRVLLR